MYLTWLHAKPNGSNNRYYTEKNGPINKNFTAFWAKTTILHLSMYTYLEINVSISDHYWYRFGNGYWRSGFHAKIRFQQLVHAIYNSNMWYLRWAFNRCFDWDNQLRSARWTVDSGHPRVIVAYVIVLRWHVKIDAVLF